MQSDENAPALGADSNVIVMNQHLDDARFPHLATVEAYWHALRGHRTVPRRAEVDPRGIENALEYAFILEQIAPGVGRLRIAGSHLSDIMGMEVRGMPLSAFLMPEARDDLANILAKLCAGPNIATLSLQAEPGLGKPVLEARVILLPLRDEAGEVNRILGCWDSRGSIGPAPRRFMITAHRLTRITGSDVRRGLQHQRIGARQTETPSGFSERHADFEGSKPTPPGGSIGRHLRLVTPQG